MILHVGCAGFGGPQEKYFQAFRMVEIEDDARPAPKLATLRRWRTAAPEGFVFTLAEPLGDWKDIAPRAQALAPEMLILRTPTTFAPTAQNRAILTDLVGETAGAVRLGWEPLGLWQREEIARLASELGLVPCIDPMQHKEPPSHDGVAYYRVRGLGGPIGERELDRIALACEGLDEVFVVFARVEDATAFLRLYAAP